jgi:hypothetical protein
MALGAALIAPALGIAAAATKSLLEQKPAPAGGYPPVPSLMDPSIWAAGTTAARRSPPASGQPQGLNWATAQQLTPYMPGLIGR